MSFDIEALEAACAARNLDFDRISPDEIEINLERDSVLFFANLIEEGDTMVGFKNFPWHSHDNLVLMTGENMSAEFSEVEVVSLLASGVLVVVSQWIDGELRDRWLAHRDAGLDLKHLDLNEELRVKRMA